MIDMSFYLMSFIEQAILGKRAQLDMVVQYYVLLLKLGKMVLLEYVDECDVVHLEGVDDEVAELAVEGEPVEVHRAGDFHSCHQVQIHQGHSTHVVQGKSLLEIQTASVIIALFHMLNLMRNPNESHWIISAYPHSWRPEF